MRLTAVNYLPCQYSVEMRLVSSGFSSREWSNGSDAGPMPQTIAAEQLRATIKVAKD